MTDISYTNSLHRDVFSIPLTSTQRDFDNKLRKINSIAINRPVSDTFIEVYNDKELQQQISMLIKKQGQMDDTGGYLVDPSWVEAFKSDVFRRNVDVIDGHDIFILQMEYAPSFRFLNEFREHLDKVWKFDDKSAVYNTGEVAKLFMAGGLGSFKPDLVRGFYQALQECNGDIEARGRLHVMGVLYSQSVKGQGPVHIRGLPSREDNIYEILGVNPEEGIVGILTRALDKVITYKIDLDLDIHDEKRKFHIGEVDVDIYVNPFSELEEYWLYSPQIFHEAYCGETDDDYRAAQTLLYRKTVLRFIQDEYRSGKIGKNLIFSTSEVNSTLAIPQVIDDEYNPLFIDSKIKKNEPLSLSEELSLKLFKDLAVHHYNHTIVPAGLPYYHDYMFSRSPEDQRLKISKAHEDAINGGRIDLVKITGSVSDVITGCSYEHTRILSENIFKEFSTKVTSDELFGNSEGSDIERWQGDEIGQLIRLYRRQMYTFGLTIVPDDYVTFFLELENNPIIKDQFIRDLLKAQQVQKEELIKELFRGTFGDLHDVQRTDIVARNLLATPLFAFVRRLVPYKCANLILDVFEDEKYRRRIAQSGATILIGGRRFSGFGDQVRERTATLIKHYPRLKNQIIFISNHNVYTSWMIQQGTDFGGMLSFKGKEAGPTSYCNAQQNGRPTFATPDGVLPERNKPIKRDRNNNIISGTGYIVEYENEPWADGDTRPCKNSFVSKLEEACNDYYNKTCYGALAYNALKMGLTEGDIRNQAKGLISVWARMLQKKRKSDPI